MWFDVQAALEALGDNEIQRPTPAIPANPANQERKAKRETSQIAEIAGLAAQPPSKTKSLLRAIEESHKPKSQWQARAGALSSHTGLGATVTYQLIDKLLAQGRIIQSKDGVLSIGGNAKGS